MGALNNVQSGLNGPARYFTTDPKILRVEFEMPGAKAVAVSSDVDAFLGFTPGDWRQDGFWLAHMHADDRDETLAFLDRCVEAGRDLELVCRMRDARGEIRHVHMVSTVETACDGGATLKATMMDITAPVELARRETKSERLDEAARILSEQFAYTIKEVSMYGDLLARHLASQGDDLGSDFALGLREAVQRMRDAVDDLRRTAEHVAGAPLEPEDDVLALLDRLNGNRRTRPVDC